MSGSAEDKEAFSTSMGQQVRERLAELSERYIIRLGAPLGLAFTAYDIARSGLGGREIAYLAFISIAVIVAIVGHRFSNQVRGVSHAVIAFLFAFMGLVQFGPLLGTGSLFMLAALASIIFGGRKAVVIGLILVMPLCLLAGAIRGFETPIYIWVRVSLTTMAAMAVAGLILLYMHERMETAHEVVLRALDREHEEREAREAALHELDKARRIDAIGRLAGGVAHDVNNALAVILANAELLRESDGDRAAESELLDDLVEAAEAASTTVQHLMLFGRQTTQRGKANIGEVLGRVTRALKRLFPETITVDSRLDYKGGVEMQAAQLEQVILNLALNARDAMDGMGRLEISVRELDDELVELRVSDNGQGMTREVREHLFEPFFTTKGIGEGAGLGLASVLGAVESSGGAIEVDSELGRGTRFSIRLPKTMTPSLEPEKVFRRENQEVSILLVEDEAVVRRSIKRLLVAQGHRVEEAQDGGAARKVMSRAGELDLLFTDAVMPNTDTQELIDEFRRRFPDAPVIVCSGWVREEVIRQGIRDSEVHFLQKPFASDELRALLERVFNSPRPRPMPLA